MNAEEVVNVRNSLWRRISRNVTLENISTLARATKKAFGRMFTCGRKDDVLSLASEEQFTIKKPIYTGPKIEVPWRGEEFKYPVDRYMTNKEILKELNLLELRFRAQSKILQEKWQNLESELDAEQRCNRETLARKMRQSDSKFEELRNLVREFKKFVAKKRMERSNEGKGENS